MASYSYIQLALHSYAIRSFNSQSFWPTVLSTVNASQLSCQLAPLRPVIRNCVNWHLFLPVLLSTSTLRGSSCQLAPRIAQLRSTHTNFTNSTGDRQRFSARVWPTHIYILSPFAAPQKRTSDFPQVYQSSRNYADSHQFSLTSSRKLHHRHVAVSSNMHAAGSRRRPAGRRGPGAGGVPRGAPNWTMRRGLTVFIRTDRQAELPAFHARRATTGMSNGR